MFSVRIL
jgi:hypothetical protein